MRELASRLDPNDPARLKAIEDRRAREAERDLVKALDAIAKRVNDGGITDPKAIQAVVVEELSRYEALATKKNVTWITETIQRSALRAEQLLKASGVKVQPVLGPRGITPELRDALTLNVAKQIESLSSAAKAKVTAALISGVNAGEGPKIIAKRIEDETAMERNRAVLIARTETNRANNQTAEDQYRKYGVQKVKWLATPDERECDVCGAHDGEVYEISDHPEIPAHPNCRCVLLPVVEEA